MTSLNDLGSCSANITGIAVRLPSLSVNLFLRSNMLRRRPVLASVAPVLGLALLLIALLLLLSVVCSIAVTQITLRVLLGHVSTTLPW